MSDPTSIIIGIKSPYSMAEYIVHPNDAAKYIRQNESTCPLCRLPWKVCIGHRIAIGLPFLYINPLYAKVLILFLNSICLEPHKDSCFTLYDPYDRDKTIIEALTTSSKAKSACRNCGKSRPIGSRFTISKQGGLMYNNRLLNFGDFTKYIYENKNYHVYLASYKLYFADDPLVVISNLLIITPPTCRPMESEDDHELAILDDLLKYLKGNTTLDLTSVNFIDDSSDDIVEKYRLAYDRLTVWYDKSTPENPATATLFQRLPTKHGIFRQSIAATRLTNSLRSVVTGSDQPFGMCELPVDGKRMLYVEVVNNINIGALRDDMNAGNITWKKTFGDDAWVRVRDRILPINVGDTVHRKFRDGDIVFVNRQPTLSENSMAAAFATFIPKKPLQAESKCIGLHPCSTTDYNADHDGDEMSASAPITYASYLEATSLMHVINLAKGSNASILFHELVTCLIISRLHDKPIPERHIPLYLESLQQHMTIEKDERINSYIIRRNKIKNIDSPNLLITYGDILSLLFPINIDWHQNDLHIENGVYIRGELTKKHLGPKGKTFYNYMRHILTTKQIALFIQDTVGICAIYMTNNIIGMKIEDLYFEPNDIRSIHHIAIAAQKEIAKHLHLLDQAYSDHERTILESNITKLNARPVLRTMHSIDKLYKHDDNVYMALLYSGARGNVNTATQIAAQVGVQYMSGKRVDGRKIPYILHREGEPYSAAHAGYVDGAFSRGLGPVGFVIHAAACRDAVIAGKIGISAAGSTSFKLYELLSRCAIEQDLSMTFSGKQIYYGGTLINTIDIHDDLFNVKHLFDNLIRDLS